MTGSGWAFLVLVWSLVIGVTAWCYWTLLGGSKEPKNPDPGGAHRL